MILTYEEALKIFCDVNDLVTENAGPLEMGIAREFVEACTNTQSNYLHISMVDGTALQIIRDICRFVDELKRRKRAEDW